jgi:hypothetical protein
VLVPVGAIVVSDGTSVGVFSVNSLSEQPAKQKAKISSINVRYFIFIITFLLKIT